MQARLEEVMTFVEEKRRELLQSIAGVPNDILRKRASTDGWSVAEILEHLRMVEGGVARLITKRAGQARADGLGEEKSTDSVLASLDEYGPELNRTLLKAPVHVQPRPDVDVSEALDGLRSSRDALRAAVVSADGLALAEIKHDHPILGELDLYQWLIFIGQHEVRHRKQIERTLKSIPQ
jgi:uncharacterized damage-inducible protein DinB